MMRPVGIGSLVLALAAPAGAGEILFENGSRLQGELASEVLLVSTGSDLLEVVPEQVGELTRDEIRLKDGRIVRGTLVGGSVKVRTALGEIAVKTSELRAFRADVPPAAAPPATAPPAPPAAPAAPPTPPVAKPAVEAAPQPAPAPAAATPPPAATPAAVAAASVPPPAPAAANGRRPTPGRRFEVVAGESALHRDAVAAAAPIGKVVRGDLVTYLDSIDRRLRILNTLVFDGGHWIKVQAPDGTVGWIPAEALREAQ